MILASSSDVPFQEQSISISVAGNVVAPRIDRIRLLRLLAVFETVRIESFML